MDISEITITIRNRAISMPEVDLYAFELMQE